MGGGVQARGRGEEHGQQQHRQEVGSSSGAVHLDRE
jgi:hypothetical protein